MNKVLHVTLSLLTVSAMSYAASGTSERPEPPKTCALIQELNLSETQQSELYNLSQEMHTNLHSLTLKHPLVEATASGSYDQALYIEAASVNAKAFNTLEAQYVGYALEVLSDTQRSAYLLALAATKPMPHCSLLPHPRRR